MNIFKRIEKLAGKMKWYDISLIKGTVLFFTLFLVSAWSEFRELVVSIEWYWHLSIGVILAIPLMVKIFSK